MKVMDFLNLKLTQVVLVFVLLGTVGCDKNEIASNNLTKETKVQKIWDSVPLGNQVAFFDKKYDLTPKEINEWDGSEQRIYELDEKSKCYLTLLISKTNGKIFQISANTECDIYDDGHGVSNPYNSKMKFKDLTKNINKSYPPLFEADCLYGCGNGWEPKYHMTFVGPHANGFVDVIYTFSGNDGIYEWSGKVIEANGGSDNPKVLENKVDYSKFSFIAIDLWSNETPDSITLRADGYK